MRPRDHQHAPVFQEKMPQRLWHREIRNRRSEQRDGFGIGRHDHVADYRQVGRGRQIIAGENPVINPTREFLSSDAVGS